MAYTSEQFRRWIENTEIDYTTYFIKAWLPFNAWYNDRYSSNANLSSDRSMINEIKRTSNPVRDGIETFMEGAGQESNEFKNYLAGLHHGLENHRLENNDERISFRTIIKKRNSERVVNERLSGSSYFLERTDGNRLGNIREIKIIIKNNRNQAVFNKIISVYDFTQIEEDTNYKKLTDTRKENLQFLFKRLKPILVTDLLQNELSTEGQPLNYYKCDSYNFKRDLSGNNCPHHFVCKGIIEVLYSLRNILFHAELIPTEGVQPIYQNAYFLLKMILNKLR